MPEVSTVTDLRKKILETNSRLAGWLKQDDLEAARKYLHSAEFRDIIRHIGFDVMFKDGAESPVYEELKQGKRPNLVIDAYHLRSAHGAPAIILRLIERLAFSARKEGGGANLSDKSSELGLRVPAPQDVGAYLTSLGVHDQNRVNELQSVKIYRTRQKMNALTRASLEAAYPGHQFALLSVEGSSSDVYADTADPSVVYKVLMPESVSHGESVNLPPAEALAAFEDEAKKLKKLGEAALSPRLYEYVPVDARPGVKLPIIRAERIEFTADGIHDVPPSVREAEAQRLIAGLEELRLAPYDTELVYDVRNRRVVAIDAGGLSPVTEEEVKRGEVSHWVCQHLDTDTKF